MRLNNGLQAGHAHAAFGIFEGRYPGGGRPFHRPEDQAGIIVGTLSKRWIDSLLFIIYQESKVRFRFCSNNIVSIYNILHHSVSIVGDKEIWRGGIGIYLEYERASLHFDVLQ